ncbi:cytochrome P450 [Phyllosticta citribraziliensis]
MEDYSKHVAGSAIGRLLLRADPISIFLALVIFLVARFLWNRYSSPLRSIPGPFLASGTRLWKFWATITQHQETEYIKLHAKYGPIVRTSPNSISVSSPYAAREILSAGKGFHKTDFYAVFPPPENPDIFTEIREHEHARKKRAAAVPYSMATMQQMTPCIENTIDLLMQKVRSFAEGSREVALDIWLHYFAFDVLGEVAFSRRFGFLDTGKDVEGCISAINVNQQYNAAVGQIPQLNALLRHNPIWKLCQVLVKSAQPLITRLALDELRKRKTGEVNTERKDLLGQLLRAHEATPEKFSEGDVFAVAHGAIFAGSDSTASTMQSLLHHVLREPHIYRRILAEIDDAVKAGRLSDVVQYNEALQLPYFQAALKEAMRMRPAVGVAMARQVPPAGAEIDGKWYPGGTAIDVHAWVLHRDRGIFGDDAEVFRPERWLEDAERAKLMDRHMFQFGGGAHICIGRNLALLEMNKVLPMLLRDFKMELIHPERELDFRTYFFVVQSGLDVRISPRTVV